MVRVGSQGWKEAARAGAHMVFAVRLNFDAESGRYWAESDDFRGLVTEAGSIAELKAEVHDAAALLFEEVLDGAQPPASAEFIEVEDLNYA